MKLKDFQAPALFSSTFKALNLGEKKSNTFKDVRESCENTSRTTKSHHYLTMSWWQQQICRTVARRPYF